MGQTNGSSASAGGTGSMGQAVSSATSSTCCGARSNWREPRTSTATILERSEVGPDLVRFCLGWPASVQNPRLRPGEHLVLTIPNLTGQVAGQWCGQPDPELGHAMVRRRYTPIASGEYWHDILVDIFTPERAPPDGGKFARFAKELSIGDRIPVSGPHGLFSYMGDGTFERSDPARSQVTTLQPARVVMAASGIAINTVHRLVWAIAKEQPDAVPAMWLALAVPSVEAAKPHQEALEPLDTEISSERLKIFWTLDSKETVPTKAWPYAVGTHESLLASLRAKLESDPVGSESTLVLAFGGPKTKKLCQETLGPIAKDLWRWNEQLDTLA